MEAQGQLRTYAAYFEDPKNRDRLFHRYGIAAYRPRLAVLIGRSFLDEGPIRKQIENDIPGLTVITYDDLLAKAKQRSLPLFSHNSD